MAQNNAVVKGPSRPKAVIKIVTALILAGGAIVAAVMGRQIVQVVMPAVFTPQSSNREDLMQLRQQLEAAASEAKASRERIGSLDRAILALRNDLGQKDAEIGRLNERQRTSTDSPTSGASRESKANEPSRRSHVFEAPSYRLTVGSVLQRGNLLTVELLIENKSTSFIPRIMGRYIVQVGSAWYVLDDRGERWEIQGFDTAGFLNDGFALPPDTVRRTEFTFLSGQAAPQGRRFTLVGFVWAEQKNGSIDTRQLSIPALTVDGS